MGHEKKDGDTTGIEFLLGQILGRLDAVDTSIGGLKALTETQVKTYHGHDLRIASLEAGRCPKPGACIEVGAAVSDLAKDVRELQKERDAAKNQIKGAGVLWFALCSIFSGLFTLLGLKLLKMLGITV